MTSVTSVGANERRTMFPVIAETAVSVTILVGAFVEGHHTLVLVFSLAFVGGYAVERIVKLFKCVGAT